MLPPHTSSAPSKEFLSAMVVRGQKSKYCSFIPYWLWSLLQRFYWSIVFYWLYCRDSVGHYWLYCGDSIGQLYFVGFIAEILLVNYILCLLRRTAERHMFRARERHRLLYRGGIQACVSHPHGGVLLHCVLQGWVRACVVSVCACMCVCVCARACVCVCV